jgi:hypothetical protein
MKKIWLPLFLLVSMLDSHGQGKCSPENVLKQKLQNYCAALPWEEIYIHSDRSEYIAGEDMWFTMYLFDRGSSKLSDYSTIACFELLNSDNRQVVKKRIRIDMGVGPAHITLPDTLSTGRYFVRAYTNWMKNFLPSNCFTMEISIYNALNDRTITSRTDYNTFSNDYTVDSKPEMKIPPDIDLKVDNHKPDKLEITLISGVNHLSGSNKNYCLLIQTHGIVNIVRTFKMESQSVRISLPKEILPPGINQIVVFNEALEPLCERSIYTPMRKSDQITLRYTDSLMTREKLNLEIDFERLATVSADKSNISISVTPAEVEIFKPDIDEYLVLGTEFGCLPELFRCNHLNNIPPEVVDSFLVNIRSNWIDWNAVISGKFPVVKHKMEKNCCILSGRLVNKNTQAPESGKYLFLSKPGKIATFQYSGTDSSGIFSFTLPVSENVIDLIIQPEMADANSSIMISSAFSEEYLQKNEEPDSINTIAPTYIARWSINYQVSRLYGIRNSGKPLQPVLSATESKRFYGKPDIELHMDDYIKLPVMEEVFFELTPGALLKRKRNNYTMTIFDPVSNLPYEKPPVVFIDGVVFNNMNAVGAMDPETVERIDVVKDLYMVGDYIFFGIVNIITKTGDCSSVTLPDYAVRMYYRVVDPVETFLSTEYSTSDSKKSRIPDFRNTLYWNPSLISDNGGKKNVEFWTSDEAGQYEISLQGINNGKPVSLKKVITVK